MMLNDHAAVAPSTAFVRPSPKPPVAAVDEHEAAHADYDLQPLRVHALEHYLEYSDNERFHVL
jgi:hypothetical protein